MLQWMTYHCMRRSIFYWKITSSKGNYILQYIHVYIFNTHRQFNIRGWKYGLPPNIYRDNFWHTLSRESHKFIDRALSNKFQGSTAKKYAKHKEARRNMDVLFTRIDFISCLSFARYLLESTPETINDRPNFISYTATWTGSVISTYDEYSFDNRSMKRVVISWKTEEYK